MIKKYFGLSILASLFFVGCNAQDYSTARNAMVDEQIKARGITDKKILDVFYETERHLFVPERLKPSAYEDTPLPIGHDQTISQPYIVALMTQLLEPKQEDVILEIGTGSGYQAAILSKLCKKVYSIEIVDPLGKRAIKLFDDLNMNNVEVKIDDGYKGWPENAPFDAIIVTCSPTEIPEPLVNQLKEGGKMIIPVGSSYSQELYLLEKKNGKIRKRSITPVMFVPMTKEGGGKY